MTDTVYKHFAEVHHEDTSPKEIVPILMKFFNPKSVIDIGCGVGNFLREFKNSGVEIILGIDGPWADLKEIDTNISFKNFKEFNLNSTFKPENKYDLAISLEVAEHIDAKYVDDFINTLTNSSENIVFSAAIPLQGGQNHINEQWNEYWIEKFKEKGYSCLDILKPYFWNNKNVFWWYKQNLLFFTTDSENFLTHNASNLKNVVHPELFELKTKELDTLRKRQIEYNKIKNGGYTIQFYSKIMINKIINKLRRAKN